MKGVFCLEGFWYGDHRDSTSVWPVLDLVHRYQNMPFIHHRCATKEEFIYSLKRWKTKSFHKNYPILYLAFHGEPGKIIIGKDEVSLEELSDLLEDKCSNVVIYFGSCSTLKLDNRKLQGFLEKTNTVALFGYKEDIDWLTSSAFEIRLLSFLLEFPFDSIGIQKIDEAIIKNCSDLVKELDFRIVHNQRIWFPRKRKTKRTN
ncbi:MAG: hypothetical protein M3Q58_11550 [Bacteroidota bacterium]|nr:hypothetical protein [Bacteroidota bacterium]